MAAHTIKTSQKIPVPVDRAWAFFSDPSNLQVITPPGMGFKVISDYSTNQMYAGQVIEYQVRPLWGIAMYWMTEITHVKEGAFFVDEQRFGPYRLWHHQHHFKEIPGGVEMTDIVHYKIPMGFIGRLMNRLFIKRKLEKIFRFRCQKVEELFGVWG